MIDVVQSRCVGVLLAGGRSTRFGGKPKGLTMLGDMAIAERAMLSLRGATERQIVISNDPDADDWFPKHRVIQDETPFRGPLAGIETALVAAKGSPVIVVAWDMPFVPTPLLRGMRALGEAGADAVVPEHGTPARIEPLCAFYGASALVQCRALLAAGESRARALAESLSNVIRIPAAVLEEHGGPEKIFMSIDSPDQLAAAEALLPRR